MPRHEPFELRPQDVEIVRREVRKRDIPKWKHNRYMILLLLHEDWTYVKIQERLGIGSPTINTWKTRYLAEGLVGLRDRPRPGGKTIGAQAEARVCAMVQKPAPKGYSHWTAALISERTGVAERTVHRVLRRNHLRPHMHRSFMVSDDPDFEAKATDIIGLYLNPPENAVVLCVDEKTQIQALDRLQPNLPLKPGRVERQTFEYTRHGITNLFAAFNTADGKVFGQARPTRTQHDFVDFLDALARTFGKRREIHVILDNLSIHKAPRVKEWLDTHRNWHFHFTPTYSSWLNQIEIWFSLVSRQCIRRGVFHSVRHLISDIRSYIRKYNESAKPFRWTSDDPGRRITEPISGGVR